MSGGFTGIKVRLQAELYDRLRWYTHGAHCSMSAFARAAIAEKLDRAEAPPLAPLSAEAEREVA